MSGLSTDLKDVAGRHTRQPPDALVPVPIGLIRAALIVIGRIDGRIDPLPNITHAPIGRASRRN